MRNIKKFKDAQAAVMEVAEFRERRAGEDGRVLGQGRGAVFKKGWRENLEEWNKVGSDYPYHYLGSAKTMLGIGRQLGTAMLELRGEK